MELPQYNQEQIILENFDLSTIDEIIEPMEHIEDKQMHYELCTICYINRGCMMHE